MSQTEYRFRRQSCRGVDDVALSVELLPSSAEKFVLEVGCEFDDDRAIDQIRTGALQALEGAGRDSREYRLRLLKIEDLSGESAPAIYCECARAAVNELLGLGHKNPFNGVYAT